MTHPCSALKQLIFHQHSFRLSVSIFFALILLSPISHGDQLKSENEISPAPLHLGLLPYLSPDAMMKLWSPFIRFLERYLHRRVVVSTAPDFKTYLQRSSDASYDLYFTAPHFAAYAEKRFGHKRVLRLAKDLDGSLVVRKDASLTAITDLRGRVVATPDRLSVIAFLAEELLSENGLVPNKDVTIKYTPRHNSAIMFVSRGHADAAVVSSRIYQIARPEIKQKLRLLARTRKVPHAMFMVRPRLAEAEYLKFRQALKAFANDEAGKAFFRGQGFKVIPITDDDMNRFLPMLSELGLRVNPNH